MDDPKPDTQDQNSKQEGKLAEELKVLEEARKNIGQGWLQLEREKSRLAAAINSIPLGFIICDETNKIIRTNPAVEKILGSDFKDQPNLLDLQEKFKGTFDLSAESFRCMKERKTIISGQVPYKDKFLKIFLSPLIILKESLAVLGTVILLEEITPI